MGNCWNRQSDSAAGHHQNSNTAAGNNQSGSSQLSNRLNNRRLLHSSGNSTSLGHSNLSARNSRLFGPSSSNTYSTSNTSTSFLGSENGQNSRARGGEEFPDGQILDAANLRDFTLVELVAATKNFRADTKLGEGAFGRVYKGLLKERTGRNRTEDLVIAIKRMKPDGLQGFREWRDSFNTAHIIGFGSSPFLSQLRRSNRWIAVGPTDNAKTHGNPTSEVNFLGRLSHPNLVKLLGFGRENGELFLVYEYMPRGSLDNQIFGRGASVHPLTWDTRLKIVNGAAKGLAFLHSLEIIYRDFKPSNILLDKAYTTKLADFGLAKAGPAPDQTHVSTQVVGTAGYAAPEYIITGHLYVKSDVYGFGIVLVEILTGKRISDILRLCKGHELIDWLKSNLLSKGKLRSTMDSRLEGKYPPKLALQVAQLALKCIQSEPKCRPSMKEVVETLEQIEAVNENPADSRRRPTHSRAAQMHGRPEGS